MLLDGNSVTATAATRSMRGNHTIPVWAEYPQIDLPSVEARKKGCLP